MFVVLLWKHTHEVIKPDIRKQLMVVSDDYQYNISLTIKNEQSTESYYTN